MEVLRSDSGRGLQLCSVCLRGRDFGYSFGSSGMLSRGGNRVPIGWILTTCAVQSVVITAILSSIFLKERLSFVGKIGCFMCIVGAIVIAINAPEQSSVKTIQDMQKFIISPGFLVYAGIVIIGCVSIIIWVAPKYGNKSMMVYLTVCSLIGGLR